MVPFDDVSIRQKTTAYSTQRLRAGGRFTTGIPGQGASQEAGKNVT